MPLHLKAQDLKAPYIPPVNVVGFTGQYIIGISTAWPWVRGHSMRYGLDGVTFGDSTPAESALMTELADAGATWWLESLYGLRGSHQEMLARVNAGPPS